MKEVTFNWSYRGIPDVLKPLLCLGGTGHAILRRYDDGWRVEQIDSLVESRTPPTLSARQKTQIEQFKTVERERQEKIRQAYAALLTESKTPTKEVARGQFYDFIVASSNLDTYVAGDYILTDVNLTLAYASQPARKGSGPWGRFSIPEKAARQEVYWFGTINIRLFTDLSTTI
jgi:hypothetical protein